MYLKELLYVLNDDDYINVYGLHKNGDDINLKGTVDSFDPVDIYGMRVSSISIDTKDDNLFLAVGVAAEEFQLVEALFQRAESYGWSVDIEDDCVQFEKWSPAGEDFIFTVNNGESIVESVSEYYDNFDIEGHVKELLIAKDNGFAGVPDIETLVDDAKEIERMLGELSESFENLLALYEGDAK